MPGSPSDAKSLTHHHSSENDTTLAEVECQETVGLARQSEPINASCALPIGKLKSTSRIALFASKGQPIPVQSKILGRWPDGSIKWLGLHFLANVHTNECNRFILKSVGEPATSLPNRMVTQNQSTQIVRTGEITIPLQTGKSSVSLICDKHREIATIEFNLFLADQTQCRANIERITIDEDGPLRVRARIEGEFSQQRRLKFQAILETYRGTGLVRIETRLENPGRAKHPGGYWDLGDPGSERIKAFNVVLKTPIRGENSVEWQDAQGTSHRAISLNHVSIDQESSGGENWRSRNHIESNGKVNLAFQGFQVNCDDDEDFGERASPVATIKENKCQLSVSLTDFWERFPSRLDLSQSRIEIGMLPAREDRQHEIQAGERFTKQCWIDFKQSTKERMALAWTHSPLQVRCTPETLQTSNAIPLFPTLESEPRPELKNLLQKGLEGKSSFFAKREVIDEYGWRNFGDLWADHEEAYYEGEKPIISHYNNQYDALHGFLIQSQLTGDPRWWSLAESLAQHITDIDIYHTNRDKAAYNGGMFWHTAHYQDAGTSTHRSMSLLMLDSDMPAAGGGPGNEHNYTAGLKLYYYLTGDRSAHEAVLSLADWVIAMDNGKLHPRGIFSDAPTGYASATRFGSFHGPGRGAGNSINALLDGWELSDKPRYLEKTIELVHRTIHPLDRVEEMDLLDAENKWSYTVYLQAIFRLIEMKEQIKDPDFDQYLRESFLRYARWMAEHEQPYLKNASELEFPTETWAAQDLRKGNVLLMAAFIADQSEAKLFKSRGDQILESAWSSLTNFPTATNTRTLVLLLQQGYIETYLKQQLSKEQSTKPIGSRDPTDSDFEAPQQFESQWSQLRSLPRSPRTLLRIPRNLFNPLRWSSILAKTWSAEQCRHFASKIKASCSSR
ncbi:MAG: hypothetical protein GY768_00430 [Planctomycetaceae bacterium]|nr:hypothetical protein [Planctomycetaceae bacterium]